RGWDASEADARQGPPGVVRTATAAAVRPLPGVRRQTPGCGLALDGWRPARFNRLRTIAKITAPAGAVPGPATPRTPPRKSGAPPHPARRVEHGGLAHRAAEETDFARALLATILDRRILRNPIMKNGRTVAGPRVIIGSALVVGMLLFPGRSSGQNAGPVPPP